MFGHIFFTENENFLQNIGNFTSTKSFSVMGFFFGESGKMFGSHKLLLLSVSFIQVVFPFCPVSTYF